MLANFTCIYRQGRIELLEIPRQLEEETPVIITFLKVGHGPLADRQINQVSPPGARPFELGAGEFVVPDDFDAPLTKNLLRKFEGRWNYY